MTPTLGCSKDELDTPALCLDLDQMEANIQSVVGTCSGRSVGWRPHTKCHKSPDIARQLVAAGALGITCAKLGEAEVMAAGGIRDILIANMIVGPAKVARLIELRRIADPIVCIDHIDQAGPISEAMAAAGLRLRVIIEVDIGLHRVGVAPGEATLALARQLVELPGIQLAGIMGYEGHLLCIEDLEEKNTKIQAALDVLCDSAKQLEDAGIECPIISCGGTGSFVFATNHPGITEVQAGGAIFMDAFYRFKCQVPDLGYAMTLIATIVSRPAPDRAIIDAGRKTMNLETYMPKVVDRDDISIESLSAEHGTLRLEPSAQDLKIGDRLEFIPGYSDMTAVLHNEFFGFRNGRLEAILPLVGRGRLQ